MSLKKIILSTVAAATVATTASAVITVQPNHIGNLLKFPVYYAIDSSGWHTKIRVANTNTDKSVVAKLVVREHTRSVEKLDILLYLSPTDVFDADIRQNADGSYELATVDDSHNLNVSDTSGRVSLDANTGETIVKFETDLTADNIYADERSQQSYLGYVEVYGLMENGNTDVNYSNTICKADGTKFDENGSVTASLTCDGATKTRDGVVNLSAPGVIHEDFVKAALLDYNVTRMAANGWTDNKGGLTGEAVILSDSTNGALAMAYQAVALEDNESNPTQVSTEMLTAAAQRGQDTNLLAFRNGAGIEELEDALAKDHTYVVHYAKDGRLPTEAANVGDMAETRLLANFITKKYSVEMHHYLGNTPYVTYGVNYAGGNLFFPEACKTTGASNNICGRNVQITGNAFDHYETTSDVSTPDSGVSGSNPGGVTVAARSNNNEVVSIDVNGDSSYADGYVDYFFTGAYQRNDANKTTTMPYIPMVMSAVTLPTSGVNVTNIKFPAYSAGKFVDRNVTQYSDANRTANSHPNEILVQGYDLISEKGLVK